jgi:hypothetical protein
VERAVRVEGLAELRKELKRLDLSKDLGQANRKVAQLVVDAAQGRASTRLERAAARSLSASSSTVGARVGLGGPRTPFAAGAEFGSKRFRQFQAWRGNGQQAGYFLYPAIRENTPRIVEVYGDEIDRVTRKAFPST